jgi:hypothetical protein
LILAPNWTGETKEIGQNIVSYFGEDRLGVKLNPFHYIIPVSHPHYYPFGSFGSDFEAGWKPFRFND